MFPIQRRSLSKSFWFSAHSNGILYFDHIYEQNKQELKKRLSKLEEMAKEGTFYIGKFTEEFKQNPKNAMKMYVALTLWMNEHLQELANGQGLTMKEIEELAEKLGVPH